LFGSRARGDNHERNDIDLAIYFFDKTYIKDRNIASHGYNEGLPYEYNDFNNSFINKNFIFNIIYYNHYYIF